MWLQVVKYSLPTVLSMWIFTLYTLVDGLFVGHWVGPSGLAAVTVNAPVIEIFFALGVLYGVGGVVAGGQKLGQGQQPQSEELLFRSVAFALFTGCALAILGWIGAPWLVQLLGADWQLQSEATSYLRVITLFAPCYMTGYCLELICKLDRSPRFPMLAVGLGGAVNLVGDWLAVVVLGKGVVGAAWATGLAQLVSFSLLAVRVGFFPRFIRLRRPHRLFSKFWVCVKAGFSDFCFECCLGLNLWLLNLAIMKSFGPDGVAAFAPTLYLTNLAMMTTIGTGQGAVPLLAEQYGRGEALDCAKLMTATLLFAWGFGALFFVLAQSQSAHLAWLVLGDRLPALASQAMKGHSWVMVLWVPNILFPTILATLGRPYRGLALSLSRGFFVVPLVILLVSHWFPTHIWLAQSVAEMLILIASLAGFVAVRRQFLQVANGG